MEKFPKQSAQEVEKNIEQAKQDAWNLIDQWENKIDKTVIDQSTQEEINKEIKQLRGCLGNEKNNNCQKITKAINKINDFLGIKKTDGHADGNSQGHKIEDNSLKQVENNGKKAEEASESPTALPQDEINILSQPFEEKGDDQKEKKDIKPKDKGVKKLSNKEKEEKREWQFTTFVTDEFEGFLKKQRIYIKENKDFKDIVYGFLKSESGQNLLAKYRRYKQNESKAELKKIFPVLVDEFLKKKESEKNLIAAEADGSDKKEDSGELSGRKVTKEFFLNKLERQYRVRMGRMKSREAKGEDFGDKIADPLLIDFGSFQDKYEGLDDAEKEEIKAKIDELNKKLEEEWSERGKIREDYRDIEDNENRWTTPDPEGDGLTDEEVEKQVLKRKKEKIEKEIEELENSAFHVNEKMRLRGEIEKIEEQIEFLEKGGKIPESKGKDLTPEDEKQFQKEIEQMPAKEKKKIGKSLFNMGFALQEWKSKGLAMLCNAAASGVDKFYNEGERKKQIEKRGALIRFAKSLAETYEKDAIKARKQIENPDKNGIQQMQSAGYIAGSALKWGRTIADFAGLTVGSPLRYVTLGAQFFSRGAEAAKEARFKNEEVINKTRIKDIDQAADEALRLYEQAKAKANQDGIVSSELLNKVYAESLPENLLNRLKNPEPGVATGFVQNLLKKHLEWRIKNGGATKITKKSFENLLKDYDRLIGEYGAVDTWALGARYAQTAGKAVIAGVAIESLYLLVKKAVHEASSILNGVDDILDGKESELPANKTGVPGIDRGVDVSKEPEPSGDFKGAMTQELEYQGGKSIWQEAEKQLMSRFRIYVEGEGKESLEVLKTLNIDKIKDAIVNDPVKYGLDGNENIDRLSVDKLQKIKWDLVFQDLEQKGAFASDLQKDGIPVFGLEEDGENILKNNETLRTFFIEHPDAPRTSENYENILKGKGDTGEALEKTLEIKDVKGRIEFENPYGIKIEAIDNKIEIRDVNNRILSTVLIEEGVGAERAINDAKIEAMHVINWSKADFENVVGKPSFELVGGKQAVFNGVIPGSNRISIDDAERAGINVFGKVGLDYVDRIKLNAWMENIKVLDTPEKAKLFFELSEQTGIKLSSSEFREAFAKMPGGFTIEQKAGYMKIFAGSDAKGGIKDLLDIDNAHAKEVIVNDDIIEVKDLVYKGKRMDVFISKDGKIGVDGDGVRLGVEKKWLGLGKTIPTMEIDERNIGLIQNRIGAREELVLGGQVEKATESIKNEVIGQREVVENKITEPEVTESKVEPKQISRETFELASKGKLDDVVESKNEAASIDEIKKVITISESKIEQDGSAEKYEIKADVVGYTQADVQEKLFTENPSFKNSLLRRSAEVYGRSTFSKLEDYKRAMESGDSVKAEKIHGNIINTLKLFNKKNGEVFDLEKIEKMIKESK